MTKNSILLRRGLVNLPSSNQKNLEMAMSVQEELMNYGFMLSQSAFDMLELADASEIVNFQKEVVGYLDGIMGVGNYKSLYGNFPHDKMSMTRSQEMWGQITHYWTHKTFNLASNVKPERVYGHAMYKVIIPCTDAEFMGIFTALLSVGNSLTKTDTEVIKWFVKNIDSTLLKYPDNIPFKENLAVIARLCPGFTVKTVVDVLRVAVGFSGGDVSLPAVPKLPKKSGPLMTTRLEERKKFLFKLKPDEKKRIMQLFESSNLDKRDMKQGSRYNRFVRLAEVLKVESFKDEFPKTCDAFHHLRNQKRKGKPKGMPVIRTWHSDVKKAFSSKFSDGLLKLSERPGEFFRRLDYLVRTNLKSKLKIEDILDTLVTIGQGSSNKVLFEVYSHFEERRKPLMNRSIFIKGARSRIPLPNLPALPVTMVDTIQECIWNIFRLKLRQLPPLGNCFIDEELKKIPLPTNMRSMSESLMVTIRGQRTPLNINDKVIRCYVHWDGGKGGTDLDLSATFISKDLRGARPQTITYSNQRLGKSLHSGDVRHKPGKCAEYIDIVMEDALKMGFQYVMFDVRDFNEQMGGLAGKKTIFGFLGRADAVSGLNWSPDQITNSGKLTTSATSTFICIFDLINKEYIWVDEDTQGRTAHDTSSAQAVIAKYAELPKFSVYDLVKMHVDARGQETPEELAATHFLFNDFSTNYTRTMELMGV